MTGLDRYLPRNDWAGPRQESWLDYLPYHVAQPVRENPLFQAVQGYLNRPSAEIKMPARDDEVPMPRKPGMLDNASPFTLDAVDKASLLATFLGPAAKTANLGALARARQMAEAGVPREKIWQQEGWFQGPDKKWRFELDDSGSSLAQMPAKPVDHMGQLNQTFSHPELFAAYPSMEKIALRSSAGDGAYYQPRRGFTMPERISIGVETGNPRSAALHEAQHAVQVREGFAPGGNPAADPSLYNKIAGEVEARAVQARRDLTPEQRRERPPWLDYDVPESQQIVRSSDSGIMASVRSRTAPNADVKPGTLPDFKDQVVAAWNKGDSLKKIAYDFGVDVRDVAPLVREARAAGNASPYRSPSARMGLTDEKIIEGLKEGRLLKDMAAEYGLREQGLHNRIRKMRLAGVFDGENAVPAPVKGTRPNAYDEPTMARLVERYKNGESFEALAADLGVSRTHITDILEPHLSGFRNVSPKASDDLLKFIKSQREQGRTFAEIAKEMGRSPAAVGGLATRARQQGWEIPAVAGMGALSYGAIEAALAPDQQ